MRFAAHPGLPRLTPPSHWELAVGHHRDPKWQKEALSTVFACGERLLGQKGKERALSRLWEEAMMTLKHVHAAPTHTGNETRVNWESFCRKESGLDLQMWNVSVIIAVVVAPLVDLSPSLCILSQPLLIFQNVDEMPAHSQHLMLILCHLD